MLVTVSLDRTVLNRVVFSTTKNAISWRIRNEPGCHTFLIHELSAPKNSALRVVTETAPLQSSNPSPQIPSLRAAHTCAEKEKVMSKLLTRKLILALALIPSAVTAAHAAPAVPSPAPPPFSPSSVTGGDPEPISPSVISMILIFLSIGIK
jgi:hypothetical protein